MGHKMFTTSDMSTDDQLIRAAETCPMAPFLWPFLIDHCDDWGRMEASVRTIKARCFPLFDLATLEVIEEALQILAKLRLIALYTIDEKRYLAMPSEKWWRHQTHIHQDKRRVDGSRFPAPPQSIHAVSAQVREVARESAPVRATSRDSIPSPSLSPSSTAATTHAHETDVTEKMPPMAASCAAIGQKAHLAPEDATRLGGVIAKYAALWPEEVLLDQAERFDRWVDTTGAPRTVNALDSFFAHIKPTPLPAARSARTSAQPRASPTSADTLEIPSDADAETRERIDGVQHFLRATRPKKGRI